MILVSFETQNVGWSYLFCAARNSLVLDVFHRFLLFCRGPQRDFDRVEGVFDTVVGYSGSKDPKTKDPTYKNIQDYAESIRVHFNPEKVSYEDLLKYYFDFHTPGNPEWTGTQYRSAIFTHTDEQRDLAEAFVKSKGALGDFSPVEDASDFYKAEEYHQRFLDKQM